MSIAQDQIRSIDQLRQRLSQLSTSIASLRSNLEREEPLPTWPSLQASAQALSFNLAQLLETTTTHGALLRQAHAYPLPNFPGHTQEALLQQLLRKKMEPGVEKWVEEHTSTTTDVGGTKGEEWRALWNSVGPTSQGIVGPMLEEDGAFGDDFTIKEREEGVEDVVTGLKRKLDGDSESEDEDDEKMDDVMPSGEKEEGVDPRLPPLSLESVLRFTTTGERPPELRMGRR
ncbi:mediator of RNA polymerase II transcription subunit 8 [Saxophila tyrrhenica]|uniref:Mediator of RNA polymerase II transcription subunit 8 n=1 Tax=Saxophila tyrrhenica TaxID=1690608 RepID=A0AAV9PI00_9PEZI|nr:mediator of RNA polymerase II transcription subunit 8 [Saxophila tyrrhenica]